ncbi:uncharacterized protein LOC108903188 [Anoplophora glabripennis]|uniref:uncharacterized protein LOC108903188 n=1 Tax=Anoplophora glabripennis TaxID=217634 RepID=UPI00087440B9|nr:uncharacterized protein LOC108903188 [Anoplophora glabripennis]
MKSTVQSSKSVSSSVSSKLKKSSKEKEKRKSQSGLTDKNPSEKGSPAKDSKQYAGISSDSICIYAEQSTYYGHLSEEVCNVLAEDINYKLRYIIHDALLKARLSGRDVINSRDIDETFQNLSIEKVYGATANPNWVPFGDQNLLYLDDTKINLIELAEEENTYVQQGNIILQKSWYPNLEESEPSPALKHYFTTICKSVVDSDEELRSMALKDISENPQVGAIIEWFYHFGYFLLMKDITYDCLTLSALDLIETLENSPLGSANVSEKQLKLLVRLLLQRLLISTPTKEVLKPMCSVLAILCLREPLREMAINKINNKIESQKKMLPVLTAIYFLGIDAVREIFLPNIEYFLGKVKTTLDDDPEVINVVLSIYGLICKASYNYDFIHSAFHQIFGDILVMFWRPRSFTVKALEKDEINFVNMNTQLIKTRRKVDRNIKKGQAKWSLEDIFDVPTQDCNVKRKIDEHRLGFKQQKRETHLTVGKTSLLLSVLKNKKAKILPRYCDHSLLSYCF